MKVNEIFPSIQGEGKYAGTPVLFIRLSECTRQCLYCDTSYHWEGKEMSIDRVVDKIREHHIIDTVVWTGGEPTLQIKDIRKVIRQTPKYHHHIETNGDIVSTFNGFEYVCFSPKDYDGLRTAIKSMNNIFRRDKNGYGYDVKIVTDLKEVGMEKDINEIPLIEHATMLMPLTTEDEVKNREIEQDVWNYCVKNGIHFCLRQHVHVFGTKKRGV